MHVDIESELVAHLKPALAVIGAKAVGTEVPAVLDSSNLPFVCVAALPAVVERTSWDRRLRVERLDADVDVFASTKVQARDVGRKVRDRIFDPLVSHRAVIESCSSLTPRPDRNENIRRYGAVASYLTR